MPACRIGLNDRAREGEFRWISDGAGPGYTHWALQQPDNACDDRGSFMNFGACVPGEDCVHVVSHEDRTAVDGTWADESCQARKAFVCSDA